MAALSLINNQHKQLGFCPPLQISGQVSGYFIAIGIIGACSLIVTILSEIT